MYLDEWVDDTCVRARARAREWARSIYAFVMFACVPICVNGDRGKEQSNVWVIKQAPPPPPPPSPFPPALATRPVSTQHSLSPYPPHPYSTGLVRARAHARRLRIVMRLMCSV
jgi:hypothetical protein